MRQLIGGLVLLILASACAPHEARLLENEAYSGMFALDGPAFAPEGDVEAVELVWIPEFRPDNFDPASALGPLERCTTASDQDRCIELLTAAVNDFDRARVTANDGNGYRDRFRNGNCIMCEVIDGYLFVVREDSASVLSFAEARIVLGVIDAPGDAMVRLEDIGLVRPVDTGYEVILKDMVCDPQGPRHTAWNIDRDGTVSEVSYWFDELGEDCDDI